MKDSRKAELPLALIIVPILIILTALAFNKIIDYEIGQETIKQTETLEKIEIQTVFAKFMKTLKSNDTKGEIEKKLIETFKEQYERAELTTEAGGHLYGCFTFEDKTITCKIALKPLSPMFSQYLPEQKAYRQTQNGLQEIKIIIEK